MIIIVSIFEKKDTVIIATLFGIVRRALRSKNLDADEIQNFKRLKLELFFGGDKRQSETRFAFAAQVIGDFLRDALEQNC